MISDDRDDRRWIEDLQTEGALRDEALSELSALLRIGLESGLKSRADYLDFPLDDFVQGSRIRILGSLGQFQNRSRFSTWGTSIAIRVSLTELRKRRWSDVSLERLVDQTGREFEAARAGILSTSCDGCLMQAGEFAERHLVGRPIPEGLRAVEQHLAICGECREEYESLLMALNTYDSTSKSTKPDDERRS